MIREAHIEDAGAIQEIYGFFCDESPVTFEVATPSLEEMKKRILEYKKYGFFVSEENGKIVSYAYASKHRERHAYQWSCEVSIYTHPQFVRRGHAKKLYQHLFGVLKGKNIVNAFAGITLPNAASVALHESLGFQKIGVYKHIGYKSGAWHDVGWWSLTLNEPVKEPTAPQLY